MKNVLLFCVLMALSFVASAQSDFRQGPGIQGQRTTVQGRVIGLSDRISLQGRFPIIQGSADEQLFIRENCFILVSDDLKRPAWEGFGGNGRFFLCGSQLRLTMGQPWRGEVIQDGTRQTRVGQRWRVLPVFVVP